MTTFESTFLDALPSPATLRHLSIGTIDFSSLVHVMPTLAHPALTRLTQLEFPLLPAKTPLPPIADELTEACQSRGIRLRIGSD
ncbi:hypothetical protein RQP46_009666 [Phenoliferia psychrophenolica]